MYNSALQCSLQLFHCSALTILVFSFDSGHSLALHMFWIFELYIKYLICKLHYTMYELEFGWWKRHLLHNVGVTGH